MPFDERTVTVQRINRKFGLEVGSDNVVTRVRAGSSAYTEGLQGGDKITHADGTPLGDKALTELMPGGSIGESIRLTFTGKRPGGEGWFDTWPPPPPEEAEDNDDKAEAEEERDDGVGAEASCRKSTVRTSRLKSTMYATGKALTKAFELTFMADGGAGAAKGGRASSGRESRGVRASSGRESRGVRASSGRESRGVRASSGRKSREVNAASGRENDIETGDGKGKRPLMRSRESSDSGHSEAAEAEEGASSERGASRSERARKQFLLAADAEQDRANAEQHPGKLPEPTSRRKNSLSPFSALNKIGAANPSGSHHERPAAKAPQREMPVSGKCAATAGSGGSQTSDHRGHREHGSGHREHGHGHREHGHGHREHGHGHREHRAGHGEKRTDHAAQARERHEQRKQDREHGRGDPGKEKDIEEKKQGRDQKEDKKEKLGGKSKEKKDDEDDEELIEI